MEPLELVDLTRRECVLVSSVLGVVAALGSVANGMNFVAGM